MTSDNVIGLRPKQLDVLCEAHPGITATSTAASAQPATTVASTAPASPRCYRLSVAPDITSASLQDPNWWAIVGAHGGPKPAPGDKVDIYIDDLDGGPLRHREIMTCDGITDAGPVMKPHRLRANIPIVPLDGPRQPLLSPELTRTILHSPSVHMVAEAVEKLGWDNFIWPGFMSKAERNEAIRDTCKAAGVHPNGLPSNRSIERFYALLLCECGM